MRIGRRVSPAGRCRSADSHAGLGVASWATSMGCCTRRVGCSSSLLLLDRAGPAAAVCGSPGICRADVGSAPGRAAFPAWRWHRGPGCGRQARVSLEGGFCSRSVSPCLSCVQSELALIINRLAVPGKTVVFPFPPLPASLPELPSVFGQGQQSFRMPGRLWAPALQKMPGRSFPGSQALVRCCLGEKSKAWAKASVHHRSKLNFSPLRPCR